ncbi:hypothetical protein CQW23_19306 [Capsicum baccatum]|uniref:Uncharacterized protein n=1 Tax=Capsicum baccatum TaxID=33114 RepID=A0A2G2W5E8_CAPBA|nr:hypothetical protein CQW23_19306 [Capsicum baccatum]
MLPTVNGGTIELLYIQHYASMTLAPTLDFYLLWYITVKYDGSLVNVPPAILLTFLREHQSKFADDAPLLPSGFFIISLESGKEVSSLNRTHDLTSALETGPVENKVANCNTPYFS